MKKFSSLLMCVFILTSVPQAIAQFAITPNLVSEEGIAGNDFEGVGHATITNSSGEVLNLTWKRTVIEITEGWTSAVCDINQCYLPFVSSQSFVLNPDTLGDMDVHVYPNGVEGAAIIEVEVYLTDDSLTKTSAMYYFNHTVGITKKFSEAIKIYPNPALDYVHIDNTENRVVKADIYNISGQLILSTDLTAIERINLHGLSAGNYLLKLSDRDSKIVSTNLLMKQ